MGAVVNIPHGPIKHKRPRVRDVTHGLDMLAYASDLVA